MEKWEAEKKEYENSLTELFLNQKEITDYDLRFCINIEKVIIGSKVEKIEVGAFENCTKLKEVEIENNKKFRLEGSYLIQNDTDDIILCTGTPAIPETAKQIPLYCFNSTERVEVLRIPKHLEKISAYRHFSIGSIEIDPENQVFEVVNNCLFLKGQKEIILGSEKSIIPDWADEIGVSSFLSTEFEKITIPGNIKIINNYAFSNCPKLSEIVFEEGLETMSEGSFERCTALKSVKLPNSLQKLERCAFSGCSSLETVESYGSLSSLPEYVFAYCGFKVLTIPSQIKSLESRSFYACPNLKQVEFSEGVKNLGSASFASCKNLEKVILSNSVILERGTFSYCEKLKDVQFSPNIKTIGEESFRNCSSLKEILFPESLECIDHSAFYECISLEKTNLNELKHLKKTYKDVFTGCRRLKDRGPTKKTKAKFPTELYSLQSFEEIIEEFKPGDTIEFLRLSITSFVAKFQGGYEVNSKKYLHLTKSTDDYFVEISDQKQLDDMINSYEVFRCIYVSPESEVFTRLQELKDLSKSASSPVSK